MRSSDNGSVTRQRNVMQRQASSQAYAFTPQLESVLYADVLQSRAKVQPNRWTNKFKVPSTLQGTMRSSPPCDLLRAQAIPLG